MIATQTGTAGEAVICGIQEAYVMVVVQVDIERLVVLR